MSVRKIRIHQTGSSNWDFRIRAQTPGSLSRVRAPLHEAKNSWHDEKIGDQVLPSQRIMTQSTESYSDLLHSQRQQKTSTALTDVFKEFKQSQFSITERDLHGSRFNATRHSMRHMTLKPGMLNKFSKGRNQVQKKTETDHKIMYFQNEKGEMGVINVQKLMEVRRALRRRYSNRHDAKTLYDFWDISKTGLISIQDVYTMFNKLGIQINQDEAQVIVACSDKSGVGALNLDAFLRMAFDEEEALQVDKLLVEKQLQELHFSTGSLLQDLKKFQINRKQSEMQYQLKYTLKCQVDQLLSACLNSDRGKNCGVIAFDKFRNIVHELEIPSNITDDKNLVQLFGEMGGDDTGINYKELCTNIDSFIADPDVIASILSKKRILTNQRIQQYELEHGVPQKKDADGNEFVVRDVDKVPINQLEDIVAKSRSIRRHLRTVYEDRQKINAILSQNESNGLVTSQVLQDFVLDALKKQPADKITKRDVEAFLSSFKYNTTKQTILEDVIQNIYEDDQIVFTKSGFQSRPLPPEKAQRFQGSLKDGRVAKILEELETKIFMEEKPHLQVFRQFDLDGDGFITQSDILRELSRLNISKDPDDAAKLLKFLDSNKNGYVNFSEFNEKIQKNIVVHNSKKLALRVEDFGSSMQPCKWKIKTNFDRTIENERVQLQSIERTPILPRPSTRYGCTPAPVNTLNFFQPPPSVPMHMSESDRLLPKNTAPINFGNTDKLRAQMRSQGRLQHIQSSQNRINQIIHSARKAEDDFIQGKLYRKAVNSEEFEKRHIN